MDVKDWLTMGLVGTIAVMVSVNFIRPNRKSVPTVPEWITLISLAYAVVGYMSGVALWLYNVWLI